MPLDLPANRTEANSRPTAAACGCTTPACGVVSTAASSPAFHGAFKTRYGHLPKNLDRGPRPHPSGGEKAGGERASPLKLSQESQCSPALNLLVSFAIKRPSSCLLASVKHETRLQHEHHHLRLPPGRGRRPPRLGLLRPPLQLRQRRGPHPP